jgi:uncharacterized Zn finger protein
MTPSRWDDPWRRFAPSAPLPVDDGLVTRSRRGAMVESWWSQRFIDVLESYGLGARMQRGRRYARTGQVMWLDVSAGLLTAQVQGSRRRPYVVTVAVATPTDAQWDVIDEALRAQVAVAAELLAGQVPPSLEDVFAAAGVPLFPARWTDLRARCSCPDDANPCKHLAAVLYVAADRLDADPWLILEWRGRTREEVLAGIGLGAVGPEAAEGAVPPWWPLRPGEPLAAGEIDPVALIRDAAPAAPDAVLRRLADLDVQAWGTPAVEHLPALYQAIVRTPDELPRG